MLASFLQRFMALVDGLMSHPRVRVTHLWVGPPATDAALAGLAEAWGAPLPAMLVALYRQADGVALRWVDVGDEMYDPTRDGRLHLDGPWSPLCSERGVATGLLDHPHYTRPAEFRGLRVPEVLLSGDHGKVRRWRRRQALQATLERRPELLAGARLSREDRELLEEIEAEAARLADAC